MNVPSKSQRRILVALTKEQKNEILTWLQEEGLWNDYPMAFVSPVGWQRLRKVYLKDRNLYEKVSTTSI